MRRQVFPTAPSPTTTHLMACIVVVVVVVVLLLVWKGFVLWLEVVRGRIPSKKGWNNWVVEVDSVNLRKNSSFLPPCFSIYWEIEKGVFFWVDVFFMFFI